MKNYINTFTKFNTILKNININEVLNNILKMYYEGFTKDIFMGSEGYFIEETIIDLQNYFHFMSIDDKDILDNEYFVINFKEKIFSEEDRKKYVVLPEDSINAYAVPINEYVENDVQNQNMYAIESLPTNILYNALIDPTALFKYKTNTIVASIIYDLYMYGITENDRIVQRYMYGITENDRIVQREKLKVIDEFVNDVENDTLETFTMDELIDILNDEIDDDN